MPLVSSKCLVVTTCWDIMLMWRPYRSSHSLAPCQRCACGHPWLEWAPQAESLLRQRRPSQIKKRVPHCAIFNITKEGLLWPLQGNHTLKQNDCIICSNIAIMHVNKPNTIITISSSMSSCFDGPNTGGFAVTRGHMVIVPSRGLTDKQNHWSQRQRMLQCGKTFTKKKYYTVTLLWGCMVSWYRLPF